MFPLDGSQKWPIEVLLTEFSVKFVEDSMATSSEGADIL